MRRFCISRKGGTRGGGWGHPQGDMHMVAAGLGCESAMVGTVYFKTILQSLVHATLTQYYNVIFCPISRRLIGTGACWCQFPGGVCYSFNKEVDLMTRIYSICIYSHLTCPFSTASCSGVFLSEFWAERIASANSSLQSIYHSKMIKTDLYTFGLTVSHLP